MPAPTTEFHSQTTDIPGLLIFEVTSMPDERGWFQEKYHHKKLVAAGLPPNFATVQTSVSYNKKAGVIRGFHAEPWDKYISVLSGRIFCAYVDLRKGESFGKTVTVEIDNNKAVYLPRGIGNSFQTLTDDVYYIYNVNDYWTTEAHERQSFANLADPAINIPWPIPLSESTMSERDRNHPLLADIKPFEF
jgi:dTDP-4-dehydrorhamnose 3,5-epimerase